MYTNIVSIVTDYIYQYTEQRSVTSPIPIKFMNGAMVTIQ